MRKSLIIALVALIVSVVAPAAQADPTLGERIIAQEKAKDVVLQPPPQTAIQRIVAQERGRHADSSVFGPSDMAPVLVAGPSDGFDLRDAGIGSAATLAFALLVAAAAVLRANRRRGSVEAAAAGS
jgi:hypothetical protein